MPTKPATARQRFESALDQLIEEVQQDRHILAAVLCGSLSHDEVYDKSRRRTTSSTWDQKVVVEGAACWWKAHHGMSPSVWRVTPGAS